jgi:pilus assembly protein CpaE
MTSFLSRILSPDKRGRFGGAASPHRLIVFAHAVGGIGATTLAVNTAYAFNPAKVARASCLIDLDIQYGRAARLLDMAATSGMELLVENQRALESSLFDRVLTAHGSGLQLLTAPRQPMPLTLLKRATLTALLQSCIARFPVVTVDLPVALTTWTDVVLKAASRIYLVTPVSVPAAHAARCFLTLLEQHGLDRLPVRIVAARRQTADKKHAIAPEKFCDAIGRSIDKVVHDDFDLIQRSHNEGIPAIELAPRSRFARTIAELVNDAVRADVPEQKAPAVDPLKAW